MSRPLLVCVIDDDPSLCAALENLLRSYGYRAVAYGSAEEFLASADADRADCIISDIQMPGMSGIDLRLFLTHTRPDLPVILMTARTERILLDRAAAANPFRVLQKPFDAQELAECLTVAMGTVDAAMPGLGRP
ncbi:response regulator transcription factor [Niveispirillum cyanobacteriorum]|uniref:response regulator transcription factor n=1 Tax=Niveispirillum cyanobacteriorum TaxID=1612173 RepID=UPI0018F831C3|nr:response regulator [Niveispirillum cyanobacteriorum]GGE83890.1 response regulator [Niveispirillum cyanobacteriorum]